MKIKKVDPQFVNAYWPFVEDWIEETVKLSNTAFVLSGNGMFVNINLWRQ